MPRKDGHRHQRCTAENSTHPAIRRWADQNHRSPSGQRFRSPPHSRIREYAVEVTRVRHTQSFRQRRCFGTAMEGVVRQILWDWLRSIGICRHEGLERCIDRLLYRRYRPSSIEHLEEEGYTGFQLARGIPGVGALRFPHWWLFEYYSTKLAIYQITNRISNI